jgi:hypothetical protein
MAGTNIESMRYDFENTPSVFAQRPKPLPHLLVVNKGESISVLSPFA